MKKSYISPKAVVYSIDATSLCDAVIGSIGMSSTEVGDPDDEDGVGLAVTYRTTLWGDN